MRPLRTLSSHRKIIISMVEKNYQNFVAMIKQKTHGIFFILIDNHS